VTTAYAQRFSATLSWFGTARGRFGIAPIPNLLLYLTVLSGLTPASIA